MVKPVSALLFLLAAMPMATPATAQTAMPPAPPASAAPAASGPGAGLWDFSVTIEGGPGGGGTRTGSACLGVEPLRAAPERTLIEAAVQSTGGHASKCRFEEVRREDTRSSWNAICEGPMGVAVQGRGNGELGTEAAMLSQALEGKMALMTITITRTIIAKRVRDC